jgi:S-formylglutathione hydrolase FrmB
MLTSTAWLVTITTVTAVALAVAAIRFDLRWLPALLECAVVAVVVVTITGVAISQFRLIPWGFPPSFYVWAALPVFALAVTVRGWRRSRVWRRSVGLASVVFAAMFALSTINAYYGYIPTFSALFGQIARDSVSAPRVASLLGIAHQTHRLPSHGVVLDVHIPPTVSRFDALDALVYLPPAWFSNHRPALPAVMLLNGAPGEPDDWTRAVGVDVISDTFAASHNGRAPILVMPDPNGNWWNDTECVDRKGGDLAETYLVTDVRRYVEQHFGVPDKPRAWAVAGLSSGGTCALTIALRNPNLFSAFADFAGFQRPALHTPEQTMGFLFENSMAEYRAHDPAELLVNDRYPRGFGAWFEVGSGDPVALEAERTLAPLARDAGMSTCVVERGGRHNYYFVAAAFRHVLPWLAEQEGLVRGHAVAACSAAGGQPFSPV